MLNWESVSHILLDKFLNKLSDLPTRAFSRYHLLQKVGRKVGEDLFRVTFGQWNSLLGWLACLPCLQYVCYKSVGFQVGFSSFRAVLLFKNVFFYVFLCSSFCYCFYVHFVRIHFVSHFGHGCLAIERQELENK